jgi:hypothetical protein
MVIMTRRYVRWWSFVSQYTRRQLIEELKNLLDVPCAALPVKMQQSRQHNPRKNRQGEEISCRG